MEKGDRHKEKDNTSKIGILQEEKPIYDKLLKTKDQKNTYKEFYIEYSPLQCKNLNDI